MYCSQLRHVQLQQRKRPLLFVAMRHITGATGPFLEVDHREHDRQHWRPMLPVAAHFVNPRDLGTPVCDLETPDREPFTVNCEP